MNKGVEILLSRMDSRPEEFELEWDGHPYQIREASRWASVFSQVETRVRLSRAYNADTHTTPIPLPFLSDEEVTALYDKWLSLQGPAFERYVMRELLEDKNKDTNAVKVTSNWNNLTGTAQCNIGSNALRISTTTLQKWGQVVTPEEEPDG